MLINLHYMNNAKSNGRMFIFNTARIAYVSPWKSGSWITCTDYNPKNNKQVTFSVQETLEEIKNLEKEYINS
jgi:hypothetical protein